MLSQQRKILIFLIVLTCFLGGGLFLAVREFWFFPVQPTPPLWPTTVQKTRLPNSSPSAKNIKEVSDFLTRYLDAYKNAKEKKNYGELKGFFSKSILANLAQYPTLLEKGITDFDNYEIEEITKPPFGPPDQYLARVKILKAGESIAPPTGSNWPIFIGRENGEFKIQNWFFIPPR